jgi:phospholipase/carboxylesterase
MKNYEQTLYFGELYPVSTKAIIMVHGGGKTGYDIVIGLESELPISNFYLVAPNANGDMWYPNSPFVEKWRNEPFLQNSVLLLKDLFSDLLDTGFSASDIYLLGFSEGASLILEFAARNAQRFGGIYAFSGGLPGDKIDKSLYEGNFEDTPVFISRHIKDEKIPGIRISETAELLSGMGAAVYENRYPGSDHFISPEEIRAVANLISDPLKSSI